MCLLLCAGDAQEPIGAPSTCSAGKTYRVLCFIDSQDYIAEVQYSNTQRNTPVSLCNTPESQLQGMQQQLVELGTSDWIVAFDACQGSSGLRGLVFFTALGLRLSCGSKGGSCSGFSSRSTYPLRGFEGSCAAVHSRKKHQGTGLTRVASITAACWTPERQRVSRGESPCLMQHAILETQSWLNLHQPQQKTSRHGADTP